MIKKPKLAVGAFILIAILAALLFTSKATAVWHLFHLATMPEDLFSPIVADSFDFHQKGASKEYTLLPKYRDYYEVCIVSKKGFRTADLEGSKNQYGFDGKFKIELFHDSQKVSESLIMNWNRASFVGNDMKKFKSLCIFEFPLPLEGFSVKNTKMILSVLEPDNFLREYKDDIELQVKVSASP